MLVHVNTVIDWSLILPVSYINFSKFSVKLHISRICGILSSKKHITFSIFGLEVLVIFQAVFKYSCNENKSSNTSQNKSSYLNKCSNSNHSNLVNLIGCWSYEFNVDSSIFLPIWSHSIEHCSSIHNRTSVNVFIVCSIPWKWISVWLTYIWGRS